MVHSHPTAVFFISTGGIPIFTRIDHVMICVPDLQQGIDAYTRIGFNVAPGGVHPGQGTHNAIALHEENCLELLSVRDRDEYCSGNPGGGLPPARVIRNTGEQAMLVRPDEACGAYIGFVGPA